MRQRGGCACPVPLGRRGTHQCSWHLPRWDRAWGTRWEPRAGLPQPTSIGVAALTHWGWAGLGLAAVSREPSPVMLPQAPTPLGPNFPMAPSALTIYEGPPSLGIVKHLIENTVKETRQRGLGADGDGHPGAWWHWGPLHGWQCQAKVPLGGHCLPSQASVERGEAPGKPPTDVLPPTQEGAPSQSFG